MSQSDLDSLTLEERNLIKLARTLSHPSNFSIHEELAQMKKAKIIAISSSYRHTYFYHRARIEPLYEGREVVDVGTGTPNTRDKLENLLLDMTG